VSARPARILEHRREVSALDGRRSYVPRRGAASFPFGVSPERVTIVPRHLHTERLIFCARPASSVYGVTLRQRDKADAALSAKVAVKDRTPSTAKYFRVTWRSSW
jgi:hypothetical protein